MLQTNSNPQFAILLGSRNIPIDDIPWTPHAAYLGVSLKHLMHGSENNGLASSHLVKVEPGCALLEHQHPGKWELHEVLQGKGDAKIGDQAVEYIPGQMALIPADTPHQVTAGDEGLVLLAKFFPALL